VCVGGGGEQQVSECAGFNYELIYCFNLMCLLFFDIKEQ
jgi:hypothetical protein